MGVPEHGARRLAFEGCELRALELLTRCASFCTSPSNINTLRAYVSFSAAATTTIPAASKSTYALSKPYAAAMPSTISKNRAPRMMLR